MASNQDMIAVSTSKSLMHQEQISRQLSVRDAALQCAIPPGTTLSESCEKVVVLMALLQGLIENTTNGDIIWLSAHRGRTLCQRLGIEPELVNETIQQYFEFSDIVRSKNPLAF
jgi:hypothetical protein